MNTKKELNPIACNDSGMVILEIVYSDDIVVFKRTGYKTARVSRAKIHYETEHPYFISRGRRMFIDTFTRMK